MLPVEGLVDQRRGLGAAAAEDDGGDRNAIGILILGREAGAIVAGRGEAAIGMGAGGAVAAVPGLALPIERVLGGILIQLLPPDSVILQVLHHIGEDGILAGGGQGIGIALGIGAGCYAKEAILGIDSPKAAIGANAQPGDIIADAPSLVAHIGILLGRDEHGQVGLSAGGGESGGDILGLALGIFDAENEHMLGHPALGFGLEGGDAQGEALFAQQHIAAVAGVDAPDGVILREVDDVAVLLAEILFGMQALDEIIAVAQEIQHLLADAGHDGHGENDIDGVGQLDAHLGKGGADMRHAVGDDIHGAALHGAIKELAQLFVGLLGVHPVICRTSVLFLAGADEGTAFYTGYIIDRGTVQIAAGQLFLVELGQDALLNGLLPQLGQLAGPQTFLGGDEQV